MKPNITALTHDHIDGSIAMADVIETLYALAKKPFPFASTQAWIDFFRDAHTDIVAKFATVTSVLQSAEALTLAADAYAKRRATEGYEYVEAKFAPQYHLAGGLTMREAIATMCNGLWRAANRHGIQIMPHVCIGREASPETGVEIAKCVLEYDGDVVLDLACDEAKHPPEKHLPAYKLTFGSNVRRECHAGEWVLREPAATYRHRLLKNMRTAVFDLKCHGISHAIPLIDDPKLIRHIVTNRIRVSGCPLSNLVCGCIKDIGVLGIDQLLDAGVIYTLNADDDLFLPSMSEVVDACEARYDFTLTQAVQLQMYNHSARFARGHR
jgi:adenosine deaminase